MNKQNRILAAIFAVQIVIILVVYRPSLASDEGKQLFGELDAGQIIHVIVRDVDGNAVTLAKSEGRWNLPDAGGYLVDADKVDTLLEKIVGMRVERAVTETSDSHLRLRVAGGDYERLIEFELVGGEQHKLYMGTASGYRTLHVRADDQDEVYLALDMTAGEAMVGITDWINPVYLSASSEQITSFTIENQYGRLEFVKDEMGEWTLAGLAADEMLNSNDVSTLVSRLSSVRMLRPLGQEEQADYGLESPQAELWVYTLDETGDETMQVLRVGAYWEQGDEVGYVTKSATSPFYVLASEYAVSDLVNKARGDWLAQSEPAEPEPAFDISPVITPEP